MKKKTSNELFADSVKDGLNKKGNYETPVIPETHGLPLSPVIKRPPQDLRENTLNSFSPLTGKHYERLKADIAKNGILVPLIARKDGQLLAGHNRLQIAKELNLGSVPVQFLETDLLPKAEQEFLIKDNLLRRQLSPADQAIYLSELYPAEFETDMRGGDRKSEKSKRHGVPLIGRIANETGLNPRTVDRAKATHREAVNLARSAGRQKPARADYEQAAKRKNEKRKAPAENGYMKTARQFVKMAEKQDKLFRDMILLAYRSSKQQGKGKLKKSFQKILQDFERIDSEKD